MTDDTHPDWPRLGNYIRARRLGLGMRTREPLAKASGISTRILGDLETGRRGRFDPKTLAAVENALRWTTGSALRIAHGGEPQIRDAVTITFAADIDADVAPAFTDEADTADAALRKVMLSDIPAARKRDIMKILIEEKRRLERQRLERADELIRLFHSSD